MDKETISSYGMIVLTVMIMSVLIIMATPIGDVILSDATNKITTLYQNTGVMNANAQTNQYGTLTIHYRYEGTTEDFQTYKTSVRIGELCKITCPQINGYQVKNEASENIPSEILVAEKIVHLYVYYTAETYNITYNLNGGTITGTYLQEYQYGNEYQLPTNVEKTGYKFIGWYQDQNLSEGPISTITDQDFGHKIFYAKFLLD